MGVTESQTNGWREQFDVLNSDDFEEGKEDWLKQDQSATMGKDDRVVKKES